MPAMMMALAEIPEKATILVPGGVTSLRLMGKMQGKQSVGIRFAQGRNRKRKGGRNPLPHLCLLVGDVSFWVQRLRRGGEALGLSYPLRLIPKWIFGLVGTGIFVRLMLTSIT